MARIAYADIDRLPEAVREQYETFPINLTRMLAVVPETVTPFLDFARAFQLPILDPQHRELVIWRVAAISASAYEKFQHAGLAQQKGIDEAKKRAIERDAFDELDDVERALLCYVDESVRRVRISDETFAELRRFYDEPQIALVTLLIGYYMLTARFLEALEVENDARPVDWSRALKEQIAQ